MLLRAVAQGEAAARGEAQGEVQGSDARRGEAQGVWMERRKTVAQGEERREESSGARGLDGAAVGNGGKGGKGVWMPWEKKLFQNKNQFTAVVTLKPLQTIFRPEPL
jgi:hypothetical protein